MAPDVLPSDVTVKRVLSDLYVMINNTADRIKLTNWFAGDSYKVEQIRFADGTVWDSNAMQTLTSQNPPTDGDDYLVGTPESDVIDGGGGYDEIWGGAGDDILYGGSGGDGIYGEEGNDYMDGGSGSDYIEGDAGDDVLYGGSGNDYLISEEGNDIVYGDAGWDRLSAGHDICTNSDVVYGDSDDILYGDEGNDYLNGNTL